MYRGSIEQSHGRGPEVWEEEKEKDEDTQPIV